MTDIVCSRTGAGAAPEVVANSVGIELGELLDKVREVLWRIWKYGIPMDKRDHLAQQQTEAKGRLHGHPQIWPTLDGDAKCGQFNSAVARHERSKPMLIYWFQSQPRTDL